MIPPAASQPRVRKHLMVAGQTRAPSPTSRSTVAVQRWVVTVLLISVAFHQRGPLSLWMIWGLLPSLVGVYFCFLR